MLTYCAFSTQVLSKTIPSYPCKDGDEVVFLQAGETSDIALVQHIDGIEKLADLEEIMSTGLSRTKVGIPKPLKGQVN